MARLTRSRSRRTPLRETPTRSRVFALIGLGLIAVATIILVAVALLSRPAPLTGAVSAPPVTSAPTPTPTPSPIATPDTPQEGAPDSGVTAVPVAAPTRLLAVSPTTGALLRAEVGACGAEDPVLETSSDDGATWAALSLAGIEASALRQLDLADATADRLVYLDAACTPQVAESAIGAPDWSPTDELGELWYLPVPGEPGAATPSGAIELPCAAVALSGAADRGIALCSDASVTVSTDAGASWSVPAPVVAIAAVGVTDSGFLIATADEPGCAGVRVSQLENVGDDGAGRCIEIDGEGSALALSGAGDTWFVWVGDSVLRSTDGGGTWA